MSERLHRAIEALEARLEPLERLVHAFARTLKPPVFYRLEQVFRYEEPELKHFCLLRSARIVSALRASLELARLGYTQEIAVLLRTVIEYANQIRFVLVGLDAGGAISTEALEFVSSYFKDWNRYSSEYKRVKLVQKRVHDVIGADLDPFRDQATDDMRRAADLLSNIYVRFSYYVHGRYPESMDLYGGSWPGRFHLSGMAGTPKEDENVEVLDTLITSASLCLKGMVQSLRLRDIVSYDPIVSKWMADT